MTATCCTHRSAGAGRRSPHVIDHRGRWSCAVSVIVRVALAGSIVACGRMGFDDTAGGASDLADAGPDAPAGPSDSAPDRPGSTTQPVLVQQKTGSAPNVTTLSLELGQTSAGDLLVMIGANTLGALTSVTGGGVTSWSMAAGSDDYSNTEIWYGVVAAAAAKPRIVIKCDTTGYFRMNVTEWSGLVSSQDEVLDQASARSGSSSPALAGAFTTTHVAELVLLGVSDYAPSSLGAPTGGAWSAMTSITVPGNYIQGSWYQVAAPGSVSPTVQTSHDWAAAIAAFQVAP